jgi:hypothetical protein
MVERLIHNRSVVSSTLTIAKVEKVEEGMRSSEAAKPAYTQSKRQRGEKEEESGIRRRNLFEKEKKEGKTECKHDGINSKWDHERVIAHSYHQWDQ